MKKKNLMLIIFIGLFVCIGFYFWKKESSTQQPTPGNGPINKPNDNVHQQQPTQIDNTPRSEYYEEHNIDNNEEAQNQQQRRQGDPRQQREIHHEDLRQHGDSRQGETPIEQLNFTQNTYNTQKASPYQTVSIKL